MRVLHITFENFQDVPGLLSRGHEYFGDQGVLVTMTRSHLGFPNGIQLNYPLISSDLIKIARQITGRASVTVAEDELKLRVKGSSLLERLFFQSRDMLWLYYLHKAWRRYEFDQYDIYHFDGDVPFIYSDRILKRLKSKRIVTHFFGTELRKFGMNPYLRERADLKITSELDHTKIDPSFVFIPIPFCADTVIPRLHENKLLRVGHSPTRRSAKGTPDIIKAVKRLQKKIRFEFLLIEGVSHKRCMELKKTCDIGIDQIGNYAGTGYGRSGLEFLALGIPTITEIPTKYESLLPDQPFINVTLKNFEDTLYHFLIDADIRYKKREQGLVWVHNFPHPRRIMVRIYKEYQRLGWI